MNWWLVSCFGTILFLFKTVFVGGTDIELKNWSVVFSGSKIWVAVVQFLFSYILGAKFSELAIEVVLHLVNLTVQLNISKRVNSSGANSMKML